MNIEHTPIEGLFLIQNHVFTDNRGEFIKTINDKDFEKIGIDWCFRESFYSISHKDVVRGMHFQKPPNDHEKLVTVVIGRVLDVVLDIRSTSKTYGQYFTMELSQENRKSLYIGKGLAHGFLSLQDGSLMEYHTTTSQEKSSESGVRWDSFGFDWEGMKSPILSVRDTQLQTFSEFISPY